MSNEISNPSAPIYLGTLPADWTYLPAPPPTPEPVNLGRHPLVWGASLTPPPPQIITARDIKKIEDDIARWRKIIAENDAKLLELDAEDAAFAAEYNENQLLLAPLYDRLAEVRQEVAEFRRRPMAAGGNPRDLDQAEGQRRRLQQADTDAHDALAAAKERLGPAPMTGGQQGELRRAINRQRGLLEGWIPDGERRLERMKAAQQAQRKTEANRVIGIASKLGKKLGIGG